MEAGACYDYTHAKVKVKGHSVLKVIRVERDGRKDLHV